MLRFFMNCMNPYIKNVVILIVESEDIMEEESGIEVSWKMFLSPKLLIAYIVCGLVWLTVTLPNHLEASENKWWKAILIASWRVIAWPYLLGMAIFKFFKQDKKETSDEDADE